MQSAVALSIVMPVYNARAKVEKALESIQNQTFTNWELLLVDDGSKDGSLELLRAWEEKDSRIHVIAKENQGVSIARNTGMKVAAGQYLTFVDADDYLEYDAYEKVMDWVEKTKSEACLFAYYDEKDGKKEEVLLPWESGSVLGQTEIWEQLIPYMIKVFPEDSIANNIFGSVWRLLVKRACVEEHQLQFDTSIQIAEDFDFSIHLFQYLESIVIVNTCLYHYIRWGNTTMDVYRKQQFQEGMDNQHRLRYFLEEAKKYHALEKRYIGSYIDVCIGSLVNFVRHGAPGLLQTMRELSRVVNQIADDSIYDKLDQVQLTQNQKRIFDLMKKRRVLTILILLHMRQFKKRHSKK